MTSLGRGDVIWERSDPCQTTWIPFHYFLNTRAFKEDGKFIVTVGSISKELTRKDIEFKGHKFDLQYGEFAPYLEECNYYLGEALKYCANE